MSENYAPPSRIVMTPQGHGAVEYGNDNNMVVMFYINAEKDEVASVAAGAPIYKNTPYVSIQPAGEHLNVIKRPATTQDQQRFPRQWNQFVMNQTQIPDGTPLSLLFPNNPALAESLKARGVHTIQQLAGLSAHAQDSIGMGAQDWVNKAQGYLKSAGGAAGFHALSKELELKNAEITSLKHQVAMQKAQIDDLYSKFNNPNAHSLNPAFVPGYDAQAARINASHVTKELATPKVKDNSGAMQAGKVTHHIQDITEHSMLQAGLGDVDLDINI